MKRYSVYDSYGQLVRGGFPTWEAAHTFKIMCNRLDWRIK